MDAPRPPHDARDVPDVAATPRRRRARRRGRPAALAAAALTAAGGWAALRFAVDASDRRFIQTMTGVPWPPGSRHVTVVSDPALLHSFWVRAYLEAPPAERAPLVAAHGFAPRDPESPCRTAWTWGPDAPPVRGHPPPPPCGRADVYELRGDRTGENRFELVFDRATGGLWITVFYPD
jgi:hypothetical protein